MPPTIASHPTSYYQLSPGERFHEQQDFHVCRDFYYQLDISRLYSTRSGKPVSSKYTYEIYT